MTEITKLIVADDHPLIREGLRTVLQSDPNFQIVGECSNGKEVLSLCLMEKPDVLILDLTMPVQSGVATLKKLKSEGLDVKVVILTMHNDREFFDTAIALGVRGYLLKDTAHNELLACLRCVSEGNPYITADMVKFLMPSERSQEQAKLVSLLKLLTAREKTILTLLAENKTSKEIADDLFISPRTVHNHRNNIIQKLGLGGRNNLLLFAIKNKEYLLAME